MARLHHRRQATGRDHCAESGETNSNRCNSVSQNSAVVFDSQVFSCLNMFLLSQNLLRPHFVANDIQDRGHHAQAQHFHCSCHFKDHGRLFAHTQTPNVSTCLSLPTTRVAPDFDNNVLSFGSIRVLTRTTRKVTIGCKCT